LSAEPAGTAARVVPEVGERARIEAEVAAEIAALVRRRPGAVLALPTGESPVGVYRELGRLRREEGLDLSRVTVFNLDEYLGLAPGDPRTLRRWMAERFYALVNVPESNRRIPGEGRDTEEEIARAGGIDLLLLGIGMNGHVAFNEPGSARDSRTRVVELHEETRRGAASAFGGIANVPRTATTMGVATILEARAIRVLAFGERKAGVVRRALEGPVGPEVPASFLRGHPDVRFLLDPAAGARSR